MEKKFKIETEVEIDIQKIFLENIKDYVADDSISDEAYATQSIYGVIRDGCMEQIKDRCEWMFKECYEQIKHHKEVDVIIGKEILKNLSIRLVE
jgi:hypothetical protein